MEARRRAYLEAMGFDVWVARLSDAPGGRMGVSAASGSLLLVSASGADRDTALGGDLVRVLGGDPVWAWLHPQENETSETLENVVKSKLITQVIVLGAESKRYLFGAQAPDIIASARVTVAPSLQELGVSGRARRTLWAQLRLLRNGSGQGGSRGSA